MPPPADPSAVGPWPRRHAWFTTSTPRRSLLLFGGGSIIGLIIAGYGLFTTGGLATALVPPEDVATVNQRPILMSDYINQLESQFGVSFAEATAQQKRKVLTDMVNEELTVQRGVELDLPSTDSDVRAAIVNGVGLQVGANVMAARPSERDLKAYYQHHREAYRTNGTMTIDEIIVPPGRGVERVHEALAAGLPATVAAAAGGGKMTYRVGTETFDLTARLALGDRLYAVIEDLEAGQTSPPTTLADGVHIVRIQRRLKPVLPPFEGAIKTVYADYLRDARVPVEAANYRYLRNRARVRYAPGYSE